MILVAAISAMIVIIVAIIFFVGDVRRKTSFPSAGATVTPDGPALAGSAAPMAEPSLGPRNAFVSAPENGILLPDTSTAVAYVGASLASSSEATPTFKSAAPPGSPSVLTNNGDGGNSTSSTSAADQPAALLSLPNVPDSELTTGTGGAGSLLSYMAAFNGNYKNVNFDSSRFASVMKDQTGIPLFIPQLVAKAMADDNFSEIKSSLAIQKDFANAEVDYMKSIKVSGDAIAFNKEAIGTEELTVQLADKASDVAAGTISKKEFDDFYAAFSATADQLNIQYVQNVRSLSSAAQSDGKLSTFSLLGSVIPVAHAQVLTAPFGGPVVATFPLILATLFTIGTPIPAEITVPDVFFATPLFFLMKSPIIGSWWLGTYNPESDIIIMAGTSLPG
jgi:hypothetical protein